MKLNFPNLKFNSKVLLEIWCNWPLAAIIRTVGAWASLTIDCRTRRRIFWKSASGIALGEVPVSISPSMVSSLKTLGKNSNRILYLISIIVERRYMQVRPLSRLQHVRRRFRRADHQKTEGINFDSLYGAKTSFKVCSIVNFITTVCAIVGDLFIC